MRSKATSAPRRRRTAAPPPEAGRMSIGALSRATGIPIETLRTWELRYGYPEAERKPSGHRLYPLEAVTRLRRIADALAVGHRPREVVGASDATLAKLIETARPLPTPRPFAPPSDPRQLFDAVRAFDAAALTQALVSDWARLGPIAFLEQRLAPLLVAVGEAWRTGELRVRHEHFVSELLDGLLRTLRQPLADRARGAVVVCATLTGELHGLGVQMAAVALAEAGCRAVVVGTDVPTRELSELADELEPAALALSVSIASQGPATEVQLRRLHAQLPARTALIVGGTGASAPVAGIRVIPTLGGLADFGRTLR